MNMKIALPMLCMLMCIATAFKPALTSHQHTPSARRRLSHLHSTPVTQSPRVGARSPEPPVCPPFVFEADTAKLANKPVYAFDKQALGAGAAFDRAGAKALLGGKGANLADMAKIGLSVPPGFTITTEVCAAYLQADGALPTGTWSAVMTALAAVEREMGRTFGTGPRPLLVSVRSGAAVSMPGMMDTILNLGLNDETVLALARDLGDRFAYDSYRRFLSMFGTVVLGIPHAPFDQALAALRAERGVAEDSQLTPSELMRCVQLYKDVYASSGHVFPSDPVEQLYRAVNAVFSSWDSDRAKKYRSAEGITGLLGTAVNVQAMCFGNMGDTSGTGVLFSRNPNTGERVLYGEYLINAQGEDVVAGIRTPLPIAKLQETLPDTYRDLLDNVAILEKHYRDMQDIEFTIQEEKLYMLQTRSGKRVGPAAVKIAVDLFDEGSATKDEAIMTVKPEHLNQLLHPQFSDVSAAGYTSHVVTKGLPASPGAAVGVVTFSPELAESLFAAGQKCILVRDDTSPEDVGGMWAAEGVLTARGGMTSHAAVVARGWGKPCICGCDDLKIDYEAKTLSIRSTLDAATGDMVTVREGEWISLNGDTGEVVLGRQPLKPPMLAGDTTARFMQWVDERKSIKVLANADSPVDAAEARKNGAQGIGLTRTEHMFFAEDRIRVVRRMILAEDRSHSDRALAELMPYQRSDFEGILEAMDGLPVTVRLLDPPLHEFLPEADAVDASFAADVGMTVEGCRDAIARMQEVNPMLGLRGCRLGVVRPQLVSMQARALIEAALNNKYGPKKLDPRPEIMIPLVGSVEEFRHQAALIRSSIEKVFDERGQRVDYRIGTMIEVPRAALVAAELVAAGAEFFSYRTNDLTQMTFGFSRDDVGSFLPTYLKAGVLQEDPFEVIDTHGVGKLIDMSVQAGRAAAKEGKLKVGVCGEHGGDPKSVRFFVATGMDYVSCSPFRVPVARLAAAQAAIEADMKRASQEVPFSREKWEYAADYFGDHMHGSGSSHCDPDDDECDPFEHDEHVIVKTYSPRRADDVTLRGSAPVSTEKYRSGGMSWTDTN